MSLFDQHTLVASYRWVPLARKSAVVLAILCALSSVARATDDPTEPTPPVGDTITDPGIDPGTDPAGATAAEQAEEDDRGLSWTILPGIFYGQETSLGFAAVVGLAFYPEGDRTDSNASNITLLATYTIRNQVSVVVVPQFYLDNNNWILEGFYGFVLFPDRFYGVGMDTPNEYQDYTERYGEINTHVQRRVTDWLWLGLRHELKPIAITEVGGVLNGDDNPIVRPPILNPSIPGYSGGLVNGLGLTMLFDWRDSVYVPTKGTYLYTSAVVFNHVLGSAYDFTRWVVDARQYISIIPRWNHVLALQIYSEARSGDVPFYRMSEFGGSRQMRGFFEGRFRDAHMLVAQAEYRLPVVWKFDAALFGGVGEVYGTDPFDFRALTWSAGVGVRFHFSDEVLARLDVGFGPDTYGFMLDVGYPF